MNTWLWVLKKLSALVLQITNKDLLNNTWNSSQCHVPAWMGGGSGGKWINVYMYMYGRVPLLFTQKYHNIVDRLYTPIQNKKFKIWKTGKKNTVSSKKKQKQKTISVKSTETVRELASFTWILLASIIPLAPTKEWEGKVQLTSSNLALACSPFQEAPKAYLICPQAFLLILGDEIASREVGGNEEMWTPKQEREGGMN